MTQQAEAFAAPKGWKQYRAKEVRECGSCHQPIAAGELYFGFRELARSSHEAIHAGRYPFRKRCACCAARAAEAR